MVDLNKIVSDWLIQNKSIKCHKHLINCIHDRDAVFRVLAVEQPQAVVLNYAPGPLDTPMVIDLLEDQRTDPGMSCPVEHRVSSRTLSLKI